MTPHRHRTRTLSILDAGGLQPRAARRARATWIWSVALAIAVVAHLAFFVDFNRKAEQTEQQEAANTVPIVLSPDSLEALLGENQAESDTAEEDGAKADETDAPPSPMEGEPETAQEPEAADQPAPETQGAQEAETAANLLPQKQVEDTADDPSEPMAPPEEFDVPDLDATFTSLVDGEASNPASVEEAAPPEAEPAPETPEETAEEPADPPPPPPDATEAAPQDVAAPETSDAATDDPIPAEGPANADPGGTPTDDPGTPAPAQPSLALPDIRSAFEVVSGASTDLAAALPDIAAQEAVEAQPDADAGTSTAGETTERPADTFYPFPTPRPGAGARRSTFSQADPSALEAVPVPQPNPEPASERAAARPQATQEPTRTAAATASGSSDGEEASYARAVRAIVGRAFFSAARLGQVGAGTAIVTVTIGRDGRLIGAEITTPSGNASLDRAVLSAAYNDFPRLPALVAGNSFSVSVPIRVR
ncbi:hypothetical protein DLJ53_00150 [Acuticoccus sediminis]|uniref:TonB C-terminal domain-containing protein n=1 Tax=Acuticoccus sediminis TaxID=2184697 RepID=A0A8B2NRX9_9HYPH|nr:TonB family protein [Acuticoccus sediminis]RAI02987.1 hypothetical protein DLJ53_00150 [Acuticoccus sediminis]